MSPRRDSNAAAKLPEKPSTPSVAPRGEAAGTTGAEGGRKVIPMSARQTSGGSALADRDADAWGARLPPELANAPVDDEPLTPEDEAVLIVARAEVARGETMTTDELLRSLGL
jgi:hypothetical protein